MRVRTTIAITSTIAVLLAGLNPASADGADRAYLLNAPGGNLFWSVDPMEPETPLTEAIGCGPGTALWGTGVASSGSCLTYIETEELSDTDRAAARWGATFWALPMVRRTAATAWDAGEVRMHLEIEASSALPTQVDLLISTAYSTWAVEGAAVAPGIYEGVLDVPGLISADATLMFGVRVVGAPYTQLRMRTGGATWIEFPDLAVRSVRGQAAAQPASAGAQFRLGERWFETNDLAYRTYAFEGDISTGGSHDLVIPTAASSIGWVETFRDAPLFDPVRDGEPGTRVSGATIELRRGSDVLAKGTHASLFQGTKGFATLDLLAGPARLAIGAGDAPGRYRAYLVVFEGARTLARTRWPFHQFSADRTPVSASCEYGQQQVPVRPEVATWRADLSWSDTSPLERTWVPGFSLPGVGDAPCAENGDAHWFRFAPIGGEVAYIGAAPGRQRTMHSAGDTNFAYDVTFTYLP